jgi:ribosomal protein S27E
MRNSGGNWLTCRDCGMPATVHRCDRTQLAIRCTNCGHELVYTATPPEPAGGAVNGLPPFMAKQSRKP